MKAPLLLLCSLALVAAGPARAQQRLPLHDGWRIQSSARVGGDGARISSARFTTRGWHDATVPSTVVGALVDDGTYPDPFSGMRLRELPGMTYPIGKLFVHLPMDPRSPFAVPWWYRTTFRLPADFRGRRVALHLDGVNYRANVWLNGRRLADSTQVVGAFRHFELDVSDALRSGTNVLAVEVFAPTPADLSTNAIDWYPTPPDKMMGLWHDAYLSASGDVVVRDPQVVSRVDTATLRSAELTVGAELRNLADHPVTGTLRGRIGDVAFSRTLTLAARDSARVSFGPGEFPQLRLADPALWWPAQLGTPALHTLSLAFVRDGSVSDSQSIRFGIREVSSERTPGGAVLFRVNGRRILIRGAGWASDIFFREQPERQLAELRYAQDMHLNTIRLEGKLEDERFWQRADSMGMLVMPGWACCSAWEEWKGWGPEQYAVAAASQRDQIRRLRSHPSAFVWLNGSDNPPPADVERLYVDILEREHWPNPYVSSAAAKPAELTGASGVKMNGPYYWVPPSYWLQDTTHGGAWGYATEIGPGAAVPPIESMRRMLPERDLWPIDSVWRFHTDGGHSEGGIRFIRALDARYGPATGLEDFTLKSQLMTYEGERAMFEGYRRNKYVATGVIQWMLNNAWPEINWHLFDWYLRPGGGYFGAKKANEPVHVMYSYDDGSVAVVNATRDSVPRLHVWERVLRLDATTVLARDTVIDLPADTTLRLLAMPGLADLSSTYFVDLRLTRADGQTVSSNFYWLSTHPDVLEEDSATWFFTPVSQYADFRALRDLPPARVDAAAAYAGEGEWEEARVRLSNPGRTIAFFVRLQLTAGPGGEEVLPVLWEDNYVTLLPGESREIRARVRRGDLGGARPAVRLSGWNVAAATAGSEP